MFGKIGGTVSVIYYLILTGVGTAEALWEELPGTVIRYVTGTKKKDWES